MAGDSKPPGVGEPLPVAQYEIGRVPDLVQGVEQRRQFAERQQARHIGKFGSAPDHHLVHRLEIGEASIIIVAASPHRAHAFAVCRYAIERVKQIVPIWKREYFEGGEVWLEGATADPDDEKAKLTAYRIACA